MFCSVLMCCLEEVYNFCNIDMVSVVNVYLVLCILMVEGMSVVCECNVVSNECNVPSPCLVLSIGTTHGGVVMYFGCVCFRGELFS